MALSRKQTGVVVGGVLAVALLSGGVIYAATSDDDSASETTASSTDGLTDFDLTSQNAKDRPRIDAVPEAVEELKDSGFTPVEPGKLTVASTLSAAPLGLFAEDDSETPIGNEVDIAQVIADGLDLELNVVPVSWTDWPLGVSSGKYDIVTSNVTVTEERLDIFDIATYRQDLLGFYVKKGSELDKGEDSLTSAEDVSGLTIAVGSGTNQEEVLLRWNEELEADGKEPADIGAATKKGNGLIEPIQQVLEEAKSEGAYEEILSRWGTEDEAVDEFRINPPGLAKQD